ncbi:MAG: hypothetical protein ACM3ML_07180 [Micromonosporaceae bacterium]
MTTAVSQTLGVHQQLTKSMAGLLAQHNQAIYNIASFVANSAALVITDSARTAFSALFGYWRDLASLGAGVLRLAARAAWAAALRARDAVLRGDQEAVAKFIEDWLKMHVTELRIEAVSAALLEPGWDAGTSDDPFELLNDLRARGKRMARAVKPIWETRLNHHRVLLLGQPINTRAGTPYTIADLVRDTRTAEDIALADAWDDEQRIQRILDPLRPDELAITTIYSGDSGLTWADAARRAGAADPAAMGERVRRKLKRLAAEQRRRTESQQTRR